MCRCSVHLLEAAPFAPAVKLPAANKSDSSRHQAAKDSSEGSSPSDYLTLLVRAEDGPLLGATRIDLHFKWLELQSDESTSWRGTCGIWRGQKGALYEVVS